MILTNDPSFTAWGMAVVSWEGKVLDALCVKTRSQASKKRNIYVGDDKIRRAQIFSRKLVDLIDVWDIKYILSEQPHGSQNAAASNSLGIVTGLLQGVADAHGIGIEWLSENDVKKTLFNRNSVTKAEMIDFIDARYTVPVDRQKKSDRIWTGVKYRNEAIADALGVYHAAMQVSNTLKLFQSQSHAD